MDIIWIDYIEKTIMDWSIFVIANKISHCGMLGIMIIKRKLKNDAMVGLVK
jgi:hypothetical protein